MRKYRLFTKIRRPNPYRLILKKTQEHNTFPNELNRRFRLTVPFTRLCTDITYVPYNHHMAYVSTIKDIATGEIVGWNAAPHITMDLVMDTLSSLKQRRHASLASWDQVLIHSDQGFHYTNPLYTHELKNLNMVQSMSRKGNCHDNAPMESFFGHMKDDIDYKNCKTFAEVAVVVNDYIEYYNNERYQWGLKKMTPVGYRDHLLATNV